MRQSFLILILFLAGFISPAQEAYAAQDSRNQYEHILSFDSDIILEKSGKVTITEKIRVYAAGYNIRRGIFRTLPRWRNLNNLRKRVKYDITSVQRDGQKEAFHTESSNDNLVIYFGSKNRQLETGVHEYVLTYETENQVGFFDTYDEFYWNVNGTMWDFATDRVSARLHLPEGATILQSSCYTGSYGNTNQQCSKDKESASTISFIANGLEQNEGLTIAVGFNKGVIAAPPPPTLLEKFGIPLLLLFSAVGFLLYFYLTWNKYGGDPEKPVVYPQFNPPAEISPASLGFIKDEYYHSQLISASLVNLAVKGYVKIIEKDNRVLGIFGSTSYNIEKLKDSDDTLPTEEKQLMDKLFGGKRTQVSFDGTYRSYVENAVSNFQANLKYQHQTFLNKGNNTKLAVTPLLLMIGLVALCVFLIQAFDLAEISFFLLGVTAVPLLIAGVVLVALFGRSVWPKIMYGIVSVVLIIAFFSFGNLVSASLNVQALFGFIIFSFITLVLYSYLIKRPSPEKLEMQTLIEGFKMYLSAAEEKTLQFHNPPKLTPEVFEKMLPYAMVLGVEKIWGEKFQSELAKSAVGGSAEYHSGWFIGNSITNMHFASALNQSLTSSIASTATQPSSSGSGSVGGGFSGGGGGGGGGGGW